MSPDEPYKIAGNTPEAIREPELVFQPQLIIEDLSGKNLFFGVFICVL
jgi:hypothetical protein